MPTLDTSRTPPKGSAGAAGKAGRGWAAFWTRRRGAPGVSPDVQVAMWKVAWAKGARARWAGAPHSAQPYASSPANIAWDAGWHWAEQNPDRRKESVPRLAHRRRRATDPTPHLTRAVQVGAVGLTLYGLSRSLRRLIAPRRKP